MKVLPGGEKLLNEVANLMAELLLSPNTRGGLLLPDYVDSEKEKLIDRMLLKQLLDGLETRERDLSP